MKGIVGSTRAAAALTVGFMLCTSVCQAMVSAWGDSGASVCQQPECRAGLVRISSDDANGAFLGWDDNRFDTSDVRGFRLDPLGHRLKTWPETGLLIAGDPRSQRCHAVESDGSGNAFFLFTDFNPFEQGVDVKLGKLDPTGALVPGWPAGGLALSLDRSRQDVPKMLALPDGGAYVLWHDYRNVAISDRDLYMQRVMADGSIAPGWPRDGLPVCRGPGFVVLHDLVTDGAGGAICVWNDGRPGSDPTNENGTIYGIRILPDGSRAPGWVEDGNLLVEGRIRPAIAPDGAGGVYVGCSTLGPYFSDEAYFAYRFDRDGVLVAGWPTEGRPFCQASGLRDFLLATTDELGGVLFSWTDFRSNVGVFVTRITSDGSLAPGWTVDGDRVDDPLSTRNNFVISHLPDGKGGAYVLYEGEDPAGSDAPTILQRVGPRGVAADGWPPFGVRLAPTAHQASAVMDSDGNHGVVVAWRELGGIGSRLGAFANAWREDVVVSARPSFVASSRGEEGLELVWHAGSADLGAPSVERRGESSGWVALGSPESIPSDRLRFLDRAPLSGERSAYRLALRDAGGDVTWSEEAWIEPEDGPRLTLSGFARNPSPGRPTIRFALPDERVARLEIVDVRGRRVGSQELRGYGPGSHVLEGPRLSAGVYWVRLRHPDGVIVRRGVVVE